MNLLAALNDPVFAGFLAASMRLAMPIMLAALGGVFNERSGVVNIGLEGMMLTGAFTGFVAANLSGHLGIGVVMAIAAGAAVGLLLGWYAITIAANQVVVGIAFNLLAVGVTSFFYRMIYGVTTAQPRVTPFSPIDFGPLADITVLGPLLFRQDILAYVGLALVVVTLITMRKTRFGLNVRAAGEHPEAAETLGLNVVAIRYICIALSGAFAGLGGAVLSLSATGVYLDNMTAGRGYIALAILILGRRHAVGVALAALLFGAADALQLRAQLLHISLPLQFLLMLPYVLTIIVLAGFAGRQSAPAALGIPFRPSGARKR